MKHALILATLFLIAGCAQMHDPILGRADPAWRDQILFANENLRQHTAVQSATFQRDPSSQLLFVTVPIRNTSDVQLYIDFRYTFFDADGNVLYTSSMMPKTLRPNLPDQIQFNSTTPRAANFELDIDYAK